MAVDNARQCQLIYEDIITSGNFNFMTPLSEMSSQALLSRTDSAYIMREAAPVGVALAQPLGWTSS